VGLSEAELQALPAEETQALVERARRRLGEAQPHYVIDTLPDILPVLDEINARLAAGETPL
jgi:phosphonoacetaldehyde hydrolase